MPKEDRFITFSNAEVYQALSVRARLSGLPDLPKGDIDSVQVSEDQKIVTAEIRQDKEAKDVKFEFPFFVLALVFFCNAKQIPIPKAGKKTLKINADGVVMRIEL